MADEETLPSGIEDPRERAEPLDRQQAGEGAIDPGLTAEAPLEFEADEFGLESPPDFAPLEALPGDGPETSFGGEATSEAEAAEDPAGADREELQQALGDSAGDDAEATASVGLSEPGAAEEPAGAAERASGDTLGGQGEAAPESEPEAGVSGESEGVQAADNVASSEMVGVPEQPEEDALQAAGEESPPARDPLSHIAYLTEEAIEETTAEKLPATPRPGRRSSGPSSPLAPMSSRRRRASCGNGWKTWWFVSAVFAVSRRKAMKQPLRNCCKIRTTPANPG